MRTHNETLLAAGQSIETFVAWLAWTDTELPRFNTP
jgi:hypothetical protein